MTQPPEKPCPFCHSLYLIKNDNSDIWSCGTHTGNLTGLYIRTEKCEQLEECLNQSVTENIMEPNGLQQLKEKYEIALEALNHIAKYGGRSIEGVVGTGKHCSEKASGAIVKITTINNSTKS